MSDQDRRLEVVKAEEEYCRTACTNDPAKYEEHLVDDFFFVTHDGELLDRDAYLERIRDGKRKILSAVVKDILVRFYGDTAVVTGTLSMVAEYRGVPFSGSLRFTKVWVTQNGKWKLASFHSTDARVHEKWDGIRKTE